MRGCCLTNLIVLGVTDPPVTPVEDMYFYYTTLTMSGNPTDFLVAGTYGSNAVSQFGGAEIAAYLQGLAFENAGGGMNSGDTEYGIWIVIPSSTAPADWTWNDVPIVFSEGGVVTRVCYEAELEFVDISNWSLLNLGSVVGATTVQGAVPLYTDVGWDAFWQTFAVQLFGSSVTGGSSLVGNTITLTVINTYLPELIPIQTQSVHPSPSTQDNFFSLTACP